MNVGCVQVSSDRLFCANICAAVAMFFSSSCRILCMGNCSQQLQCFKPENSLRNVKRGNAGVFKTAHGNLSLIMRVVSNAQGSGNLTSFVFVAERKPGG